MDEKIPVIFDTDIGSDIDDAVCLAYLLSQPRCDLLGITTVSGEPIKRAELASALCHAAGRADIPIFAGAVGPIIGQQKQPAAQQAETLAKWRHDTGFKAGEAVEWMRQTIRKHPGEITLLAVGPMTNLALLFTIDPEIPKLLKSLVLMCGVFTTKLPWVGSQGICEWNALIDPIATSVVYNADVASHTSIGLDVTLWCRMPAAEVRERFQGPVLSVVKDFAEVWFRNANEITFHDPLAGVSIFEPDVCEYKSGLVQVELQSDMLKGMTYWNPGAEKKPHRIATSVNSTLFFDKYFSTVC